MTRPKDSPERSTTPEVIRRKLKLKLKWKRQRKPESIDRFGLPDLDTVAHLAEWLEVSNRDLNWLCNPVPRRRADDLHYDRHWIRKRSSGWRLIESPQPRLKKIQRTILDQILNQVPPHSLATGFCLNRNILDHVKPHIARPVCLKMDLLEFFPSVRADRVFGLFHWIGYPREVAYRLALLSTVYTHPRWFESLHPRQPTLPNLWSSRYAFRHLPQGAPGSPAIANLCAFRLDARLSGLARHVGGVHYTRYADDLLFSGDNDFGRQAQRLQSVIGAIAIEEGFEVNFRKTRIMRSSQKQKAAGVVLNQRPNIDRREFDRLKAILHNCIVHGARSQNRENHRHFCQHLRGKVEWVTTLNPARGEKLKSLFMKIDFES